MSNAYENVISKLEDLNCNPTRMGNGHIANCPAHDDKIASLKIDKGDKKVLLECHANCHYDSVVDALGMKKAELYYEHKPKQPYQRKTTREKKKPAKAGNHLDNILDNPDQSSVRNYTSLADYAIFKGFSPEVFINAGVYESTKDGKPTIVFPTKNGNRHRFLNGKMDNNTPKFKADPGFSACWFKLDEALQIAREKEGFYLIICNGEPSTVLAQHCKIPACCISGGEGKNLKKEIADELKTTILCLGIALADITIMVSYDMDETGITSALKLVEQLTSYGFKAKAIKFIDNIFKGYDLADFVKVNKYSSYELLLNLPILEIEEIKDTASQNGHQSNQNIQENIIPNDRMQIISNHQHNDILPLAVKALEKMNIPYTVFRQENRMVRIKEDLKSGKFTVQHVEEKIINGMLFRGADWKVLDKNGIPHNSKPVKEIVHDILVNPPDSIPELEQLISSPTFTPEGKILKLPGYHKELKVYYPSNHIVQEIEFNDQPTIDEVEGCLSFLKNEVFNDFPFCSQADYANFLATLLEQFIKFNITSCRPLRAFEAATPGTGKGLLVRALCLICFGREIEITTAPETREEWPKLIISLLLSMPEAVFLDNIGSTLKSADLDATLTSPSIKKRLLGSPYDVVVLNKALWMCTGNNMKYGGDLPRRIIPIRMVAMQENPADRPETDFKQPDLLPWIKLNRSLLIHCCLTIIQYWVNQGKPQGKKRMGSFESWSANLSGLLATVGVEGFMNNLEQVHKLSDAYKEHWIEFVGKWFQKYGEIKLRVGELNQFCEENQLMLGLRGDGEINSKNIKLGNALKANRDRIYIGFMIQYHSDSDINGGGVTKYSLRKIDS